LTEKIYYADKTILDIIRAEFDLIENEAWYELYQNKNDKSFWRLDRWDKYQEPYFIHLETGTNWTAFDAKPLQIQLLRQTRGNTDMICAWEGCPNFSINGMVFCEHHAWEMGIRK
jgi:hypothetical protein